MNTMGLMSDPPAWAPWASVAVDVAYLVLGVVAIVIVSCVVAQIVTAEGRAPEKRTHRAVSSE
jgi:hypothetical protein